MAKKNRAPRPAVDIMYLNKNEIIPGVWDASTATFRTADHEGWYDPQNHPDFIWAKYREWKQKMEELWQESQIAHGGVVHLKCSP